MSSPSFHTARFRSKAALMPAHCTPAISDMIVVLVYGAEYPSVDIFLYRKTNSNIVIIDLIYSLPPAEITCR